MPVHCWSLPDLVQSPSILLTVFAFLLMIGPLIVIHELGHYWAGRLCGVRALTFSAGFGKELWHRIDKHGTRWRIAAFPLGGYVQFAGDADASSRPDPALDGASQAQLKGTLPGAKLWQSRTWQRNRAQSFSTRLKLYSGPLPTPIIPRWPTS